MGLEMIYRFRLLVVISGAVLLVSCAQPKTERLEFTPIDKSRFASQEKGRLAGRLAVNKCRAHSLKTAARIKIPTSRAASESIYTSAVIAERNALERASFIACMNEAGWIEADSSSNGSRSSDGSSIRP